MCLVWLCCGHLCRASSTYPETLLFLNKQAAQAFNASSSGSGGSSSSSKNSGVVGSDGGSAAGEADGWGWASVMRLFWHGQEAAANSGISQQQQQDSIQPSWRAGRRQQQQQLGLQAGQAGPLHVSSHGAMGAEAAAAVEVGDLSTAPGALHQP